MTPETLRTAISEAERFLRVAKKAEDGLVLNGFHHIDRVFSNQSDTAAAKRASLDLTKALAAMRRAG